jgi:hypothetical protein
LPFIEGRRQLRLRTLPSVFPTTASVISHHVPSSDLSFSEKPIENFLKYALWRASPASRANMKPSDVRVLDLNARVTHLIFVSGFVAAKIAGVCCSLSHLAISH